MVLAAYNSTVTDDAGNVVPSATVTVTNQKTGSLAVLFSDRDGTVPLSNPFTAGADGFFEFYTEGSAYKIEADDGTILRTVNYVGIGTLSEYDIDDLSLGIIEVQKDDVQVVESATKFNFKGDISVVENPSGTAEITVNTSDLAVFNMPVGQKSTEFSMIKSSDGTTISTLGGQIRGADGSIYLIGDGITPVSITPTGLVAETAYWLHVFTDGVSFSFEAFSGVGSDGPQVSGSLTYVGRLTPFLSGASATIIPFENFKGRFTWRSLDYVGFTGDGSRMTVGQAVGVTSGEYSLNMLGVPLYGSVEVETAGYISDPLNSGISIDSKSSGRTAAGPNAVREADLYGSDFVGQYTNAALKNATMVDGELLGIASVGTSLGGCGWFITAINGV